MTTRILHFIDTLGAGGTERQLVYLLQNLPRRVYESQVVTTYDTFRHYEPLLRSLGIPIYGLHHGPLTAANRARAMVRYVRLLWALHPDIVQSWSHYPNLIAGAGRPFCPPHKLLVSTRTELSSRERRTETWVNRIADFRIVNRTMKNSELEEKDTVIENALSSEFFSIPEKTLNLAPFTALIVARIDPRKDHLTLLKALHLLKDRLPPGFNIIFLGEVSDPNTQSLINQAITDFGLHDFVQQLPPTHDVIAYYRNATITILPSRTEGTPNAVLESLATGTPVIVSEAANHSKLITHRENGWVFPTGESAALAECLEQAWKLSAPEYLQMSAKCRQTAAPYSIERMIGQYIRIYGLLN